MEKEKVPNVERILFLDLRSSFADYDDYDDDDDDDDDDGSGENVLGAVS